MARAAWRSNQETAVPRLLAMLCVVAVFLPSFFMEGAAREMFVPLSLAVGFAMIAAYFLSSTFVPVLSVWMLRPDHTVAPPNRRWSLARFQGIYARGLQTLVHWRWIVLGGYAIGSALIIALLGPRLGMDLFPRVSAREFQLRLRASDGTRIEVTTELAAEVVQAIENESRDETGANDVAASVAYCGLHPTSYTINNMYMWMRGPEEALLRVGLNPESTLKLEPFQERLRRTLPGRLDRWLRERLRRERLSEQQVTRRLRACACRSSRPTWSIRS